MWGLVVQSGSKGRILGEFQHTLDEKGRLAVPAKYRSLFADGAVVTRGFEKCLVLYPNAEWEAWAEKVTSLPNAQPEARRLMRLVFSGATDCELDKLGRINIPAYLRQHAELNGEVALVGLGTRMEIWDRQRWAIELAATVDEGRVDIDSQIRSYGI
ncbi:MAG: division/cell wall cluster transcriptional repressor MraZ [Chloroflexota bacterium]